MKFLTDFLPLIVFFTLYKMQGIMQATTGLVLTSVVVAVIYYFVHKKLPVALLVSTLVVGFFGALTIFSKNEIFIKIKPTIINLVFAAILFGGVLKGKGLLKHIFGQAFVMEESAWITLSKRWALLFLSLALINELVWRNFSTDIWVDFKVFGLFGITFIFLLTQLSFIKNNSIEKQDSYEK